MGPPVWTLAGVGKVSSGHVSRGSSLERVVWNLDSFFFFKIAFIVGKNSASYQLPLQKYPPGLQ